MPHGSRVTRGSWAGAAAVSAAALGLAVTALLGTPDETVPNDPAAQPPTASPGVETDANRGAPVASAPPPREQETPRPVSLRIPGRDLAFPVRPVGVTRGGVMALPADPRVLGWYRFGPAPGAAGSSVLAGHLDSVEFGVGPLVRLDEVRRGDRIRLRTATGEVDRFVVTRVDRYDRQRLPPRLFARSGPSRLRLVTCAGEYDANAGGYQLNLVVTAAPR